jgi:hypothetical protein
MHPTILAAALFAPLPQIEAPPASGSTCGIELAKFQPSGSFAGDRFGWGLAISGNTALIGADFADHGGLVDAGVVYVFERSGSDWVETHLLTASDAVAGAFFGQSIAFEGDTAFIGAPHDDDQGPKSGSVYVFERTGSTWSELGKVLPSDGKPKAFFGAPVVLCGDEVVIGAPLHKHSGLTNAGAVYTFARSGSVLTEQAKLVASVPTWNAQFGTHFSKDGDRLAVGAYQDDNGGVNAGSVHVFERSGGVWSETAKLVDPTPTALGQFGHGVLLEGDSLFVGAPASDAPGSVFEYELLGSTWVEQVEFSPANSLASDYFGSPIVRKDGELWVGSAIADTPYAAAAGAIYVFQEDVAGWTEVDKLFGSNPGADFPIFGWSFVLTDQLMVSASLGDFGSLPGSVYVFDLDGGPVNYCTSGISANGCQALISATGTPSATATSGFTLSASNVEGAKNGIYFFGTGGRQTNSWGNGTSLRCVLPPVARAGVLTGSGTDGSCDGAFAQDLNALWCPSCPKSLQNPGAGARVQVQLWYRDPLNTSNQSTSLSDAVEFCVQP